MESNLSVKILPMVGIEIKNVNLAVSLPLCEVEQLIDYYNHYHLLIIKNQILSEKQLIKVSKIFGEPIPALVPTYRLEKYPVITKHTNIKDENKLPRGVIAPEYVYHSDSYFTCNPSKTTLLYSLRSPFRGGETYFINMCTIYDSFDECIKKLIADK